MTNVLQAYNFAAPGAKTNLAEGTTRAAAASQRAADLVEAAGDSPTTEQTAAVTRSLDEVDDAVKQILRDPSELHASSALPDVQLGVMFHAGNRGWDGNLANLTGLRDVAHLFSTAAAKVLG